MLTPSWDVSRPRTRVCAVSVDGGGEGTWEITKANLAGEGDVRKELKIFASSYHQNLQGNKF